MIACDNKAVLHSQRNHQMLLLLEILCSNFLNYPCQSVFFFSALKMLQNSLKTRWIFPLITITIFSSAFMINLLPMVCLVNWTLNDLLALIIAAVSIQFYTENIKEREFKPEIFIQAHTASAAAVKMVSSNTKTDKDPWGLFSNSVLKEIYNSESLWQLRLAKI